MSDPIPGERDRPCRMILRMRDTKHSARIVTAIVSVLLAAQSAWPWGRAGHRVSAVIAESRLTPAALKAVREILDGQSLADIADWADQQWEIPGSSRWHYVDVPITSRSSASMGGVLSARSKISGEC